MNYLKRLQKEVDHILSLCDEAALLQRKLAAATHRLDSLELEYKGIVPMSLQEMRNIDGFNYENWDDFIKQTGPYEPVNWSGYSKSNQVFGQLSGRSGATARYNKLIGFDDGYQLLLNCLVAAHHIDPATIEPLETLPDWQQVDFQRLASIDIAQSNLDLMLPLPHEIEEGKFCVRVRSLLVTAINARHMYSPIETRPKAFEIAEMVDEHLGNNKLLRLLKTGYRSTSDWYRRHVR